MSPTYIIQVISTLAMTLVLMTLILSISSVVRARLNKNAEWGKDGNQKLPPLFEKMFEKAAAERDEKIRKLESRVEVLEKIATDSHTSDRLADEIEKLKDR